MRHTTKVESHYRYTLTIGGSIIVQLTPCLFWLDSAALRKFKKQQFYLFRQIQTGQTGSQPYSDTLPYSECS